MERKLLSMWLVLTMVFLTMSISFASDIGEPMIQQHDPLEMLKCSDDGSVYNKVDSSGKLTKAH